MRGNPNPIIRAETAIHVEAVTIISSPTFSREVSETLYTSIIFSLLSDELQCPAILHWAHADVWRIRTLTYSPSIASIIPECFILLLIFHSY